MLKRASNYAKMGGGDYRCSLALMDNIPEYMALGISLVTGGAVNIVLIAANFHLKLSRRIGFN
jgi:hypothetical protein